jgi:hypothetical protein
MFAVVKYSFEKQLQLFIGYGSPAISPAPMLIQCRFIGKESGASVLSGLFNFGSC